MSELIDEAIAAIDWLLADHETGLRLNVRSLSKEAVNRFKRAREALSLSSQPPAVVNGAFYDFADQLANWMNATDSGEMTVQQFRSALNVKLLEMRPAVVREDDAALIERLRAALVEIAAFESDSKLNQLNWGHAQDAIDIAKAALSPIPLKDE